MRFLLGAIALTGAGPALAHSPEAGILGDLGHQLTSLHHLPAALFLAVLATLLVVLARRNRATG